MAHRASPIVSQTCSAGNKDLSARHTYPASEVNCLKGDTSVWPNCPLWIIWAISIPSSVAAAE